MPSSVAVAATLSAVRGMGRQASFAAEGDGGGSPRRSSREGKAASGARTWPEVDGEERDLEAGGGGAASNACPTKQEGDLRAAVWATLEDPSSSRLAYVVGVSLIGCIVISSLCFVAETVEELKADHPGLPAVLAATESTCNVIFTVEFAVRLLSTPSYREFFRNPLNHVDLVAILPFYLDMFLPSDAGSGLAVVKIVRLSRVLRMFKLSRYSKGMRIFLGALARSSEALVMLVLFMSLGVVLFGSLMYYAERGEFDPEARVWFLRGEPSQFQSIPHSFWWCIATMTTVGYGDISPVTPLGKWIASATMISGLLVLSLPMSVIGANFGNEMERVEKEEQDRAFAEESALNHATDGGGDGEASDLVDSKQTFDLLRARLAAQIQAAVLESLENAGASILPVWRVPPRQALGDFPNAIFGPASKTKSP